MMSRAFHSNTVGSNPAHALDAAMSFGLHIGRHWRGASDVHCSAYYAYE
jgi:hypothetical protein